MKDVKCPYCKKDQEINHDDGYGYEEDAVFQQECSDCNKIFTYTTSIMYNYDAEQADCLNGSDHEYKLTTTYPKFYSMMRCIMCNDERKPTAKERKEYDLDKE